MNNPIFRIGLAFVLAIVLVGFATAQEKIGIVTYTPPKDWAKTPKQGAVVYTVMDKTTNAFCVLTVYGESAGTGNPQKDFANEWNELVVKPFKADTNPKTETQAAPDGWQGTAGGAEIDMTGIKAIAILTVFTGFGKTASVLTIFNDQSYLAQMQTFIDGIKLDKTQAASQKAQSVQNIDPFPDRPGYQPQKPLSGKLKDSITMADLVGTWDNGAASVQTYVDSNSGNYSGTNTTFYSDHHSINADGSFEYKFTGHTSNHTIRESDSGNVILSGSTIIFKFKGRSTYRYQLIAYMTQPNGAAILSLIPLGENEQGYDAERMRLLCGHSEGYIHCAGGEEWARLGAKRPN